MGGLGDTKHSKSKTPNDGLARSVSGGQTHPGQSQQVLLFPGAQMPPPVPHWLSTMERTVSWMSPLHVALFPYRVSFFLPSQLTSAFLSKHLQAGLSLPPTSCLLRGPPGTSPGSGPLVLRQV